MSGIYRVKEGRDIGARAYFQLVRRDSSSTEGTNGRYLSNIIANLIKNRGNETAVNLILQNLIRRKVRLKDCIVCKSSLRQPGYHYGENSHRRQISQSECYDGREVALKSVVVCQLIVQKAFGGEPADIHASADSD